MTKNHNALGFYARVSKKLYEFNATFVVFWKKDLLFTVRQFSYLLDCLCKRSPGKSSKEWNVSVKSEQMLPTLLLI
ncbi:unnamed protein product [Caenorhabditis nigoni]